MEKQDRPLLSVRDFRVHYPGPYTPIWRRKEHRDVRAVDGVSFAVVEGETAGLVGESGCGKSTAALGILRLVPATSGSVAFGDIDVLSSSERQLLSFRRQAQIVFQDPYSSLHPRKRIESIVGEPLEIHTDLSRADRRRVVEQLLVQVGLQAAAADRYARELSGGQRQRVAIARALALKPRLVVLDEPLSALDVSIRAQILELLRELQREFGLTYLFISHDLALVRSFCSSVYIMYLGKIVEQGESSAIFARPSHPYTRALLSAVLIPDPEIEARRPRISLIGEVPSALNPPSGCRFHPRCPFAKPICVETEPPLQRSDRETLVACHFWEEVRSVAFNPTPVMEEPELRS